jgi:hypothetical protein
MQHKLSQLIGHTFFAFAVWTGTHLVLGMKSNILRRKRKVLLSFFLILNALLLLPVIMVYALGCLKKSTRMRLALGLRKEGQAFLIELQFSEQKRPQFAA